VAEVGTRRGRSRRKREKMQKSRVACLSDPLSNFLRQDSMWYVDVMIDLIFLCDVGINFRTAYSKPGVHI
jgi:hypothetical protein